MDHLLPKLAILLATSVFAGSALAADSTEADANKLLDKALEHIKANGWEKSVAEFNNTASPFNSKSDINPNGDLYVFTTNFKGDQAVHGRNAKIRGINSINLRDQNGVEMIKEFIKLCQSKEGRGTVKYVWPHPINKTLDGKLGLIRRIPGEEQCIGTGISVPK